MQYKAKCFKCDTLCTVETEMDVPLFNQTKKRNWLSFVCENCKTENKGAKMTLNSNLLLAIAD